MSDSVEKVPAREELHALDRRIRETRAELLGRGVDAREVDRELGALERRHEELAKTLADERSPMHRTLDADVAALRSTFDDFVERIDGRFARPMRRTTGP